MRVSIGTAVEHELEQVVAPRVLLRELVSAQDSDELGDAAAHRLLRFADQRLQHADLDVVLDVLGHQLPVAELGEAASQEHKGVLSHLEVLRVDGHIAQLGDGIGALVGLLEVFGGLEFD